MKKLLFTIGCSLLLFATSVAQLRASLCAIQSDPLFNMKKQGYLSGAGIGFGFDYIIHPKNAFSLDLGVSFYGSDNGTRSQSSPLGSYEVNNTFGGVFLEARIVKNFQKLSPYLECHYGFISYYTEGIVSGISEYLTDAASVNCGVGFGTFYRVNDNFYLDCGVMYNSGSNVNFLDLHSFNSKDNVIDYNINKANSNMLIIKLGIVFNLKNAINHLPVASDDSSTTPPFQWNGSSSSSNNRNSGTIIRRGKTPVRIDK